MFSGTSSQASVSQATAAQRSFQRVSVNIGGRLMLADHEEYACTAIEMSPGDVSFQCAGRPRTNERVIAYLDHLGRIEGTILSQVEGGFLMDIAASARKRDKMAAQLTWLANRHSLGLREERRAGLLRNETLFKRFPQMTLQLVPAEAEEGAAGQYFGSSPWMPRAKAVAMAPVRNGSSP